MNQVYRVALICGAIPLLVGVSIFVLWLIIRWDGLMTAGIYILYGGVAVFVVGIIALARFFWLAVRTAEVPRRRISLLTLACTGLLLLNFPVAGGIIVTAIAIETRYTVVVHNGLSKPLEIVRVVGGGNDESLGSIPPGGTARRSFWIQHDGELRLHAVSGSTTHTKTINGYVTNGMGGHTTVTVNSDGTISISQDDN